MNLLLVGGTVVTAQLACDADVRIQGNEVIDIGQGLSARKREVVIDCSGQYVYPGLINAHDHLSFNLFPRLGNPPYRNSYDWGNEIKAKNKALIDPILRLPLRDRLSWGAWKNIFSGVTTVVHHDPYFQHFRLGYPVDVLSRFTWAHSLGFENDIRERLVRRKRYVPFILHLAEGTDDRATAEVGRLAELGGLDERTVAVHAVGITDSDIEALHEASASVVWCPASNYFLFRRTAPVKKLRGRVRLAIGTDSTLTGSPTLFDELRLAHNERTFTAKDLFSLVTDSPRRIFCLPHDAGTLIKGGTASLFLLPATHESPYATLMGAQPGDISLLLRRGEVFLHDSSLDKDLGHESPEEPRISLNGKAKWVGPRRLPSLLARLKPYLGHYPYLN